MLITSIVTVFNRETTLQRTLASIKAALPSARHDVVEVIIVDNNSTDGSKQIAKEFCRSVPSALVLEEPKQGVSFARNRGLAEATGRYITYIDSDDFISENYYEEILFAAQRDPDVIFVPSPSPRVSQDKLHLPVGLACSFYEFSWWNWQFIYKKCLADGLTHIGCCYDDFGFYPFILSRGKDIVVLNRPIYTYVQGHDSVTLRAPLWRLADLQLQFARLEKNKAEIVPDLWPQVEDHYVTSAAQLRAMAGSVPVRRPRDACLYVRGGRPSEIPHRMYRLFRLTIAAFLNRLRQARRWQPQ